MQVVSRSPTMKSDGIFSSQNGHFTPKEQHIQTMISVCISFLMPIQQISGLWFNYSQAVLPLLSPAISDNN